MELVFITFAYLASVQIYNYIEGDEACIPMSCVSSNLQLHWRRWSLYSNELWMQWSPLDTSLWGYNRMGVLSQHLVDMELLFPIGIQMPKFFIYLNLYSQTSIRVAFHLGIKKRIQLFLNINRIIKTKFICGIKVKQVHVCKWRSEPLTSIVICYKCEKAAPTLVPKCYVDAQLSPSPSSVSFQPCMGCGGGASPYLRLAGAIRISAQSVIELSHGSILNGEHWSQQY
jgi:hypothetical protein